MNRRTFISAIAAVLALPLVPKRPIKFKTHTWFTPARVPKPITFTGPGFDSWVSGAPGLGEIGQLERESKFWLTYPSQRGIITDIEEVDA